MTRTPLIIGLVLAWTFGFACLGIAWGAEPDAASTLVVPGPGGALTVNVGDLTFPGAVVFGFWMLARTLPSALKSWKPTLRLEVVQSNGKAEDDDT